MTPATVTRTTGCTGLWVSTGVHARTPPGTPWTAGRDGRSRARRFGGDRPRGNHDLRASAVRAVRWSAPCDGSRSRSQDLCTRGKERGPGPWRLAAIGGRSAEAVRPATLSIGQDVQVRRHVTVEPGPVRREVPGPAASSAGSQTLVEVAARVRVTKPKESKRGARGMRPQPPDRWASGSSERTAPSPPPDTDIVTPATPRATPRALFALLQQPARLLVRCDGRRACAGCPLPACAACAAREMSRSLAAVPGRRRQAMRAPVRSWRSGSPT